MSRKFWLNNLKRWNAKTFTKKMHKIRTTYYFAFSDGTKNLPWGIKTTIHEGYQKVQPRNHEQSLSWLACKIQQFTCNFSGWKQIQLITDPLLTNPPTHHINSSGILKVRMKKINAIITCSFNLLPRQELWHLIFFVSLGNNSSTNT